MNRKEKRYHVIQIGLIKLTDSFKTLPFLVHFPPFHFHFLSIACPSSRFFQFTYQIKLIINKDLRFFFYPCLKYAVKDMHLLVDWTNLCPLYNGKGAL